VLRSHSTTLGTMRAVNIARTTNVTDASTILNPRCRIVTSTRFP
jgi:hypothetical protein